ncbi:MAG: ATP-grasp domain-containing protein [Pseudomonadota bacterium]|nr:ATP-grasp domain-containing protein [Pseudomonadota bacterium]
MNILVTSIAKKIPLLREVHKALSKTSKVGKLFGADSDKNCIGRYFCDSFWSMPTLEHLTFSEFSDFCRSHEISGVIPSRDGELLCFAQWSEKLEEAGISIMVSAPDVIAACLDKLSFYQTLKDVADLNLCPTATDINQLPEGIAEIVVKERFGSASEKIAINVTRQRALDLAKNLEHPIFQPFIEGQEYSVDLYRTRQGCIPGVIVRSRDLIVAGESQISTTVENVEIEKMCLRAADILNLQGHIVFQGIIDKNDDFQIIECNPRFGGASTLSIAAGLDSFFWFLRECRGYQVTKKDFVKKSLLRLIRYPQDLFLET